MTDEANQPLIFPIANYIGETFDASDETTTYDLRGGWKVQHLTQSERDIWGVAHGIPDQIKENRRWTRAALLEAARPHVWDDVDHIVEDLLSRDVLAEVSPGTRGAIEFAEEYRLVPLQLGLGNTREEPWVWRIGPGVPVIGVSNTVYHVWEWCHLYKSLWDSCKSLAKIREKRTDPPTAPAERDPEAILTEVLETTHMLLSTTCAYFDVPFDWGTA